MVSDRCTLSPAVLYNAHYQNAIVRSKIGVIQGQVISTMREACRQSFLDWSPRLYLAMYSCDIQASGTKFKNSNFFFTLDDYV
jgi:ribosome assembly protein 1